MNQIFGIPTENFTFYTFVVATVTFLGIMYLMVLMERLHRKQERALRAEIANLKQNITDLRKMLAESFEYLDSKLERPKR